MASHSYGSSISSLSSNQQTHGQYNQPPIEVLKEAFPAIDPATIHAILLSTKGQIEPATNALLAISSPNTPRPELTQHTSSPYPLQAQPHSLQPNPYNYSPQVPAPSPGASTPHLPPRSDQYMQQSHSTSHLAPQAQASYYNGSPAPVTSNAHSPYLAPVGANASYFSPPTAPDPQAGLGSAQTHLAQSSSQLYPVNSAPTPYPPPSPSLYTGSSVSPPYHQNTHSSPSNSHLVGHVPSPHPQAPPHLYPASSAPSYSSAGPQPSSQLPDISSLSLGGKVHQKARVHRHWAQCDGCEECPIRGLRWQCVPCQDYDLCDKCKQSGVHNEHRFELIPPGAEVHDSIYCDGCGKSEKSLLGPRFACKTHQDEDWCERCVNNGRACGGPYEVTRQTELGRQIELEGCLPMPEHWLSRLGPAVATYNIEENPNAPNWIRWPLGIDIYSVAKRDRVNKTVAPAYHIETKISKGHFVSDHKHSWVLKRPDGTKLYSYTLETDRKTNQFKGEQFSDGAGRSAAPVWKRGALADSLSFEDPSTGTSYCWLSNRPVSILGDERFDFQRLALFERRGGQDVIVADFAWWDGHEDAEDCLTIRDPKINHALVIASMNIVHDHHWKIMAEEQQRDPTGVAHNEERARLTMLGCAAYWFDPSADAQRNSKYSSAQKLRMANMAIKTTAGTLEFANNVMTIATAVSGGGSGS